MATVRIVPALHPLEDRHPRFGLAAEPSPVEHFALERGEERFSLSLRDVEDLLAERGINVTYETIRQWCRSGSKIG